MSNKRLVIILSLSFVSIVAIVLIGLFVVLNQFNKPENTIRQFETAVEEKNPSLLQDIIIPNESGVDVNEQSVTALLNYLKTNDHSYQAIKDGFHKQIEKNDFTKTNQQVSLVQDGKKWGLFKQYKFFVKTATIKVSGQYEEDTVYLTVDQSELPSEEGDYGPVLPGTYPITLTVENEIGKFTETKDVDVWGNDVITYVVDTKDLVKKDENTTNEIMEAVDTYNYDVSVFDTNGFNLEAFTNFDNSLYNMEYTQDLLNASYTEVVDYIDEIYSKYKGATVNLSDFVVHYFDGEWTAAVKVYVSYDRKMKIIDINEYEDLSYDAIRHFKLSFDKSEKRWLITEIIDHETNGEEHKSWKETLKLEGDSTGLKWMRPENTNPLSNL